MFSCVSQPPVCSPWERRVFSRRHSTAPPAQLWAAGKEEGHSQLTDKWHGHLPRAQAELAAPAPLCWLLEAAGLTWITEGVCTWVVWSQQLWPGASRETADVRDLQKHKLGGRDTEDLVLKVIVIYFLY